MVGVDAAGLIGALATLALVLGYLVWRFFQLDADWTVSSLRVPEGAFRGKMVVIVGASSGIGAALALRLAKDGARLVLLARRVDRLEEVADRCRRLGSPSVDIRKFDQLDSASIPAFFDRLVDEIGAIDVLVNNAGRSQRGLAEDTDVAVTRDMMELNVITNIAVAKAVVPHMLRAGSGHIVVTSSVAGKVGAPISSSYSATKHAIQGYYNALRNEVAYRGIDVTLVCPGPVESEITDHAFTDKAGVKGADAGFKPDATNRMSAERCAELMARSIAFPRLFEIWVSPQPILFFTYLGQYAPSIAADLGSRLVGPRRVKSFQAGQAGYAAVQSLAAVFGLWGSTPTSSSSAAAAAAAH